MKWLADHCSSSGCKEYLLSHKVCHSFEKKNLLQYASKSVIHTVSVSYHTVSDEEINTTHTHRKKNIKSILSRRGFTKEHIIEKDCKNALDFAFQRNYDAVTNRVLIPLVHKQFIDSRYIYFIIFFTSK